MRNEQTKRIVNEQRTTRVVCVCAEFNLNRITTEIWRNDGAMQLTTMQYKHLREQHRGIGANELRSVPACPSCTYIMRSTPPAQPTRELNLYVSAQTPPAGGCCRVCGMRTHSTRPVYQISKLFMRARIVPLQRAACTGSGIVPCPVRCSMNIQQFCTRKPAPAPACIMRA